MTPLANQLLIILRQLDMSGRASVTAYQLLAKLPADWQEFLIARYGRPGKGCGKHYSAASAIANAQKKRHLVDVQHFDTTNVTFSAHGATFAAGTRACGLYRVTGPTGCSAF